MANPTDPESFSDVLKVGYLRKWKSMHKRFFVLRTGSSSGPARLEYYENEKKWRHKAGAPKRSIPLERCFSINKRVDAKNKYLVALYTKDEYFAVAADSEEEQEGWYACLLELHGWRTSHDCGGEESYSEVAPGPTFREVWQVILKPKGLAQTKNLIGVYRLCLTLKTMSFVKLNSDVAAVVLQLVNIRRCGHSENFFYIEMGRSAVTGSGEFWMQVEDSVVAQNMHETFLKTMKTGIGDDFRPRSKSQPNCSNPITVPLRRHHHGNPPPSQVGLSRRSRTESITATSPANVAKQSSFRVRASSDGEGTMSRPASVDGSPGALRTHSQRHRGAARLHPPLNHSRSIPMSSSRCSPSATSPVSLSSSSTSGHGSTTDCRFPRRSSASVSGSPSDGGFISSDEYGSSPCDFRSSFRSVTPEHSTPPARDEEAGNYTCMEKGAPCRGEENDPEKGFRKRTHSAGTSPPAVAHQKTPSQYTEMMPYRHSAFVPTHSYPEECLDGEGSSKRTDDGYMPMSPGVAPEPAKNPDYMPMSPKSVSAPQQILNPRRQQQLDSNGYVMMMSPSGSCSPDGYNAKLSVESTEGKLPCADYINMSPVSGSTTSTPPDCYLNPPDEPPPKPVYSYFSLPRSFKHVHRQKDDSPLPALPGLLLCAEDSSSSSTSSDSLGGPIEPGGKADSAGQTKSRAPRPTRLSLDGTKASTESKSPGEYVNIEISDKAFSYVESRVIPQREDLAEYMGLGGRPRPPSATQSPRGRQAPLLQQPRDYVSMQLGAASGDATGDCDAEMPDSLLGQGSGLSAFTRVNLSPSHSQSAKVIRADPQGRRRHSSETFSSTTARASVASLPCGEDVKRHSSASFENVWLRKEQQAGIGPGAVGNGLNYIDLDLAKDLQSQEGAPLLQQPSSPSPSCGSTSSDESSAYASIAFQKSEDLRSDSAKTEE